MRMQIASRQTTQKSTQTRKANNSFSCGCVYFDRFQGVRFGWITQILRLRSVCHISWNVNHVFVDMPWMGDNSVQLVKRGVSIESGFGSGKRGHTMFFGYLGVEMDVRD